MYYKNLIVICCLLIGVSPLTGCKKKSKDTTAPLTGTWTERSNFEGVARSSAVAFTIKDTAYLGTGFDGTKRLNDFWQYNPTLNFWQQKADFPGVARSEAMGFGIGSKGYIGTGYDGSTMYKDFYEYDPYTNSWMQKADYGGTARYGGTAFTINNRGYAGTGFDGNNKKDMWKYIPESDTWTAIVSITGEKRINAASFVIGNKGYIASGVNNGVYLNDIFEYDTTLPLGTWTAKASLSGDIDGNGSIDYDVRRSDAVGFSLNSLGYISTGFNSSQLSSTWAFDPNANTWTQVQVIGGAARMDAVAFTVKNRAFVTTGRYGNSRLDDIWEFIPY